VHTQQLDCTSPACDGLWAYAAYFSLFISLLSSMVKGVEKSVNIWQSYEQTYT